MKVTKVALFGHIPAGTLVWLTAAQAKDRLHAISEVETDKRMKDRALYAANAQLGFKKGEELAIEGELDRGLEAMFGIEPAEQKPTDTKPAKKSKKPAAPDKAALEGAEADVTAAQAVVATAEQAAADADAEHKAQAEAALEAAKVKLTEAEAALALLKA